MKASFLLSSLLSLLFATCLSANEPPHPPSGRALFFSEPDYRGEVLELDAGIDAYNLAYTRDDRGRKWDDRIASFRIEGDAQVVLFSDPRYRGERIEFNHSIPDLSRVRRGESGLENWDHCASALKVVEQPTYRHPQSQWPRNREERERPFFRNQREADRAIYDAFRDLLGREPDYDGLQNYRRRLLDEGWDDDRLRRTLRDSREYRERDLGPVIIRIYTQELGRDPAPAVVSDYARLMRDRAWSERELRREISNSREARQLKAELIVTLAYREVLGREPDPEGFRRYVERVAGGASEAWLRGEMRNSEEYRRRKP